MYLRDLRSKPSNQPDRSSQILDRILLNFVPESESSTYHYRVFSEGAIEYLHDIEKKLSHESSIDVAIITTTTKPSAQQLQAVADLLSFLLLPRTITPLLTSLYQVFPSERVEYTTSKVWELFKSYLLGTKGIPQPQLLAEYKGQTILLPHNGSLFVKVIFTNTGAVIWRNSGEHRVTLNIAWEATTSSAKLASHYHLDEGTSLFYHPTWLTKFSPCTMQEPEVKPGQDATFIFTLAGNSITPGHYREDFGLALDNQWIDNIVNGNKANKAHCWFAIEVY